MAQNTQTFSESWYRIANQRISLRLGIKTRRQNFRGERWIVLADPFSNQFYRLRPAAYEFVSRLRPDRTVDDVWKECVERFPDEVPGQESVIQLLSQLYHSNLLQYDLAADSAQLFERYSKRRQRETRARLLQIMFMRFPLLDPDRFLVRTLPYIGKLIGIFGALLWLGVVGMGVKVVLDNFSVLKDQSQSVLAPDNIFLLYAGMIVIKTLHEFGHAYFCRKFGGEVHTMGLMLLIFTPIPYMDATSSWGFRSRWKRVLVGAAGMIVEVFFAAIAALIWARTGEGAVHTLAYNIMFIASVSTLLFNINPLLRFDGYYILSDLLDIPNLHQRSGRHLKHLVEHFAFGVKNSESPARTRREAGLLTFFGIAAGIYRIVVFATILLFVADQFLLVGLIMVVICLVSWLIVPIGKLIKYLSSSPKLERCRLRANLVVIALAATILVVLQVIPFRNHIRAPGVLEATHWAQVTLEASGDVAEVLAKPGQPVKAGQPLIRLTNHQLELELGRARSQYREIEARIRAAMQLDSANLKPLESSLVAARKRVERFESDLDAMTLRARQDGLWVAPGIENYIGRWVSRGTSLGLLVDPSEFTFTAVVSQDDSDILFKNRIQSAQVRFPGEAGTRVLVKSWNIIPAEQNMLSTPALGWAGGGPIPVDSSDSQGLRTSEPFFRVECDVPIVDQLAMVHGRTGKIRFRIDDEPLLSRWLRRFRQLLQKRYQF